MDFTIITPNLNYGRFLVDCLASVASQPGVTLEHFVFDAGSTDESAEVAAGFPHVKWQQEPDRGMSDAINKGFERAKGNWVMWLNADDRLKPDVLRKLLTLLNHSKADIVYGDYDFMDESGKWLRTMKVPRWSSFVNIYHHCYIPSTAAFIRNKTVLAKGHRLREDFRYVMDGEFYLRLASEGLKIEHVPLAIADFRLHSGNTSQKYLRYSREMDVILAAELQHVESRAIRRAYGFPITFKDPYLTGLVDGALSIMARGVKVLLRLFPS